LPPAAARKLPARPWCRDSWSCQDLRPGLSDLVLPGFSVGIIVRTGLPGPTPHLGRTRFRFPLPAHAFAVPASPVLRRPERLAPGGDSLPLAADRQLPARPWCRDSWSSPALRPGFMVLVRPIGRGSWSWSGLSVGSSSEPVFRARPRTWAGPGSGFPARVLSVAVLPPPLLEGGSGLPREVILGRQRRAASSLPGPAAELLVPVLPGPAAELLVPVLPAPRDVTGAEDPAARIGAGRVAGRGGAGPVPPGPGGEPRAW
jgi:hypothetical protein